MSHLGAEADPSAASAIDDLISENRLVDAAEIVRQSVSHSRIARILKTLFSSKGDLTPIHKAIWETNPAVVFTTNYDNLLERSFVENVGRPPYVFCGLKSPALDLPRGAIGKLHGDPTEPQSIVLSTVDYLDAAVAGLGQPQSAWINMVRRPTVALGYSLNDPDLRLLLRWAFQALAGLAYPVYVLIPERGATETTLLRALGDVVPIEYSRSTPHRTAILKVLRELRAKEEVKGTAIPGEVAVLARAGLEQRAIAHDMGSPLSVLKSVFYLYEWSNDGALISAARRALDELESLQGTISISPHELLVATQWSDIGPVLKSYLSGTTIKIASRLANRVTGTIPLGPRLFVVLVRTLITNAVETDGSVKVELNIGVARSASGSVLRVSVKDDGPGLDPDIQERLFRPGASSKGPPRGMGLYLLRQIVETCGGSVTASSSPGKGALFQFEVPIVDERAAPVVVGKVENLGRFRGSIEVIVVDDNQELLIAATHILKRANCRVRTFSDGRAALRSLRRRKTAPDCLLTDLVLVDISGQELATVAREKFPNLPVVVMSGFVSELPDGLDIFVAKPFKPGEMIAAIQGALA
jgi:signal transduction histidine kinase/CheY-like chemotaxis protein